MRADRLAMNGQAPAYRPDIDGLRAVAVLAVVAYHAFPNLVPGGFVGVDVFFVISGFLITGILRDGLAAGTFGFGDFYARRIRRILPALVVVLAASLAMGWWLLDPGDYAALGRHALASALFVPNLLSWQEAGYFDTASELKPLLHLWSLGVEEQFYLLWPLLLWVSWPYRRALPLVIAAVALVSFASGALLLQRDPVGAFFLPYARVWELAIGALLAALAGRLPAAGVARPGLAADAAAALGLAMIVSACFVLDTDAPFPGARALLPTVGTALLVAAGPRTWSGRALSVGPMVWIGLLSYPLYLWHWPLLSLARLGYPEHTGPALRLALVAASLLLAWLTWRWIERPVRSGPARRWKVVLPSTALALVAAAAGLLVQGGGAPQRVDVDVRGYADYVYDFKPDSLVGRCWLGMFAAADAYAPECVQNDEGDGTPLLLVWGDSHAARLTVGLRVVADGRFRIAQFTRDGCQPLLVDRYPRCIEANMAIVERIRALRPEVVVLFSFWATPTLPDRDATLRALDDTVTAALSAGAGRVVVVGPSAQWNGLEPTLPKNLYRKYRMQPFLRAPARMVLGVNPVAGTLDRRYAAHFAGRDRVRYFSAYDAQCDARGCMTRAGDDPYDLMTWDYGHLTTSGATYVATRLLRDTGLPGDD